MRFLSPLVDGLKSGTVDLTDPATTVALLNVNAVVGVTGFSGTDGKLRSMGIQCALCHSTVDDSFAPGIGHRLDGWANRDLNIGAIIALAPDLSVLTNLLSVDAATVRTVLNSWGPGKFDAELSLDGKAFRPDGKSAAMLIPPAFGLAGVNLGTWTGFGSTTYWNAFVANLEMHGKGTFYDPRLNDATQFPVAAKAGSGRPQRLRFDHVEARHPPFLPARDSRPAIASERSGVQVPGTEGEGAFQWQGAMCALSCSAALYRAGVQHAHPEEIGIDDFQANRSPTKIIGPRRLKGLFTHMKGGFYHDGRFPDLRSVVDHYDSNLKTGLSDGEKADLIAYLMTL